MTDFLYNPSDIFKAMAPKKVMKSSVKKPACKAPKTLTTENVGKHNAAHEKLLKKKFESHEDVMDHITSLSKTDQEQIWKASSGCK